MRLQRAWPGRRARRGFTLVEIMIVILITGVLLNIAAPAFIHARDLGQARACVSNLHNINTAKEVWALQNDIPANDPVPPTWLDVAGKSGTGLQDYLRAGTEPVCPSFPNGDPRAAYNINDIATLPTCNYGGAGGNVPPHQF